MMISFFFYGKKGKFFFILEMREKKSERENFVLNEINEVNITTKTKNQKNFEREKKIK